MCADWILVVAGYKGVCRQVGTHAEARHQGDEAFCRGQMGTCGASACAAGGMLSWCRGAAQVHAQVRGGGERGGPGGGDGGGAGRDGGRARARAAQRRPRPRAAHLDGEAGARRPADRAPHSVPGPAERLGTCRSLLGHESRRRPVPGAWASCPGRTGACERLPLLAPCPAALQGLVLSARCRQRVAFYRQSEHTTAYAGPPWPEMRSMQSVAKCSTTHAVSHHALTLATSGLGTVCNSF